MKIEKSRVFVTFFQDFAISPVFRYQLVKIRINDLLERSYIAQMKDIFIGNVNDIYEGSFLTIFVANCAFQVQSLDILAMSLQ